MIDANEPQFENGLIARAVNIVEAEGVSYFSAAGNDGTNSYASVFRDGGKAPKVGTVQLAGDLQNESTTSTKQLTLPITIPKGQPVVCDLQWDSNYASLNPTSGGSKTQCNLYLVNGSGTQVVASATTNTLGKDPDQDLFFTNSGSATTFGLAITWSAGPAPKFIKVLIAAHTGDSAGVDLLLHISGGTVSPHSAAAGAMAVGAVQWDESPRYNAYAVTEAFSAFGSDTLLFNDSGVRLTTPVSKGVSVVGPDLLDVNPNNDPTFPRPFSGTSCAAPDIAGAAALMLAAAPKATPTQIYTNMEKTAISMAQFSPQTSGYGTVNVYKAMALLASQLLPAPAADCSISGSVRQLYTFTPLGSPPTGPGLANVFIYLDLTGTSSYATGDPYTYTDAKGNFTFKNLKPGLYTVRQRDTVTLAANYPIGVSYSYALGPNKSVTGALFGDYVY